jgi:DNA-binding transcriptional LysR family regulator
LRVKPVARSNRDFSDERLRYLYESTRLGSMRAASEFFNMAPSSISRQIAGLEKELGIELIERSRHTIQLTTAGQLVLQYYRDRLSQREALTASIDDIRGHRKGHIVLAVGQGLVRMPLVRSLAEFVVKYPGLGLTIKNASTRDVASFVRNDEAHFGITLDSPHDPRIRTRMVIPQPLCLILYPKHPLARQKSVAIRDLQEQRLILPEEGFRVRQILNQVERERGIFLQSILTASSIQMLADCVLAQIGITIIPDACVLDHLESGELISVPIADQQLRDSKVHVVTRVGRQLPGSVIRLIDILERKAGRPKRPQRPDNS